MPKKARLNRIKAFQPYTIYCVGCRQQHRPAGAMADCIPKDNRAALKALCELLISKPIAAARIPDVAQKLELTITR